MKLEDKIKNKLAEHEEVFDPKAWDQLASKLDAKMPVSSTSSKWSWIAASVAIIAIVTGVILVNSKDEKVTSQTNVVTQNLEEKSIENSTEKVVATKENIQDDFLATTEKSVVNETKSKALQTEKVTSPVISEKVATETPIANKVFEVHTPVVEKTAVDKEISRKGSPVMAVCPSDENKVIESYLKSYKVKNELNQEVRLKDGELYPNTSSSYSILNGKGEEIAFVNVIKTKLDVVASDLIYENGLPQIPVTIKSDLSNLKLVVDGKSVSVGKEAFVPAYLKGAKQFTIEGSNGQCIVKETFKVDVAEDYNLLAVNAFNVNSSEDKNKTFLPYALVERNEAFEMQILDPKTGDILFTTNSINHPWDGRDYRTGELVAPNKRYVWTVRLSEKANFETKNVYQGAIMRVTY